MAALHGEPLGLANQLQWPVNRSGPIGIGQALFLVGIDFFGGQSHGKTASKIIIRPLEMGKVLPGILAAQLEICFQCFQQVVNGQPARLRSRERARADHIRADFPQTGFQNLFGGLWVRALRALAEFFAAQIVGNP